MISDFIRQIKQNNALKLVLALFLLFTFWWISIYVRGLTDASENDYFTITYPIISLIGGIVGWSFARKWGGLKSTLGISISMFSFGLLAQFLGQMLYVYYIYILGIDEPYPSIGDVSYLASVIFYIVGVYYLAKVSGIRFTTNTLKGKLLAVLVPILILVLSYFVLLKDYVIDFSDPVLLFFDFGFPIGQAVYVSIALLALFISKDILGGMMRKPIMLLIFALVFQYFADFAYSYQYSVNPESMYVGDFLDYLYFSSYFLMTISLFAIGNMFYKVQES